MIFGLARAGRVLGRPEWIAMAAEGLRVVADKMTRDGRFLAARRGRQSGGFAFLDDCAFLLEASLELLRADFRMEFLDVARRAAEQMTQYFEDDKDGGFFFTAADGEKLIRRPKAMDDNAVPSGNGAAARSLPLLSWLCGEEKWEDAAARSLRAFGGAMQKQPAGCASLLSALRLRLSPPSVVLLLGDSKICKQWREALERDYSPELLIYVLPPDAASLPPPCKKPRPPKAPAPMFATASRASPRRTPSPTCKNCWRSDSPSPSQLKNIPIPAKAGISLSSNCFGSAMPEDS